MRFTVKYPFLHVCWFVVTVILSRLFWKPHVTLETKLLILLFMGGFVYLCLYLEESLEKLDHQVWRERSGFR